MTTWVLTLMIATDLWIAVASYDTERQCLDALDQWEFQPGAKGTCLPGVIEKEKPKSGRRR